MIPKRRLAVVLLVVVLLFIITTNYLHSNLTKSENQIEKSVDIPSLIYQELEKLPDHYKVAQPPIDTVADTFIKNINSATLQTSNLRKLWKLANSWVSKTKIVDLENIYLGQLHLALKTSKIMRADIGTKGTQLKLMLTLEGNQTVIFKPKRFEKDRIFNGPVYGGKDSYGAEIVGFYLSALLNKPLVPFSVERIVSLTNELTPVASKLFLDTSFKRNNRTCVYGKCFYCKKQDSVCDDSNFSIPGAVIFNVDATFKNYRSPWQRSYKDGKKAAWEVSNDYCKFVQSKLSKQRVLDLIDTSIFDFLIQNGDRHHYETLHDNIVLLDNGKGFRNPYIHHIDILAPLYQCCSFRKSMMKKLQSLSGGSLRKKLEAMPEIYNFITEAHLKAMEERLLIIFATVEYCRNKN